jgi:hypothetical protein
VFNDKTNWSISSLFKSFEAQRPSFFEGVQPEKITTRCGNQSKVWRKNDPKIQVKLDT